MDDVLDLEQRVEALTVERDALKVEVARLRDERFQAQAQSHGRELGDGMALGMLTQERDALRAEVRRLRGAIASYVASEDGTAEEQERTWAALDELARATDGGA